MHRGRDTSQQAPRVTCEIQRGRGRSRKRGERDQISWFPLSHDHIAAQNITHFQVGAAKVEGNRVNGLSTNVRHQQISKTNHSLLAFVSNLCSPCPRAACLSLSG